MRFSPNAPYLLIRVLTYTGLVIPNVHFRRLLFIPILLLTCFTLYTATDSSYSDFKMGTILGASLFTASDYLLLCSDVQNDVRFDGQKEGMSERPLKERLVWAFRLFTGPRAVGTNIEATTHLPPRPSRNEPRKTYIIKQLIWMALYCPLWYTVIQFNKWNPRFNREMWASSLPVDYSWWWRFTVWATIIDAYVTLVVIYSVMSIISVGLNMSKAHEWPPMFASPLEAYTLRRYWGRMWHQLYRRFLTSHADYAASHLRLPPRSKITSYFKLFLSFFISGILHTIGDYTYTQKWIGDAIRYFMLHACAITLEDFVVALGKRMGLKESPQWKLVGYAWVVLIFTILLPDWIDASLSIIANSNSNKAT